MIQKSVCGWKPWLYMAVTSVDQKFIIERFIDIYGEMIFCPTVTLETQLFYMNDRNTFGLCTQTSSFHVC